LQPVKQQEHSLREMPLEHLLGPEPAQESVSELRPAHFQMLIAKPNVSR